MEEPPWDPPNLFTNPINTFPPGTKLKDVVGSDVLAYLPLHWWNQAPLEPIYCYIFAALYIVGGKETHTLSTKYTSKAGIKINLC